MMREQILSQMALYYPTLGWEIFPLTYPIEGQCSCSNPECKSPGKHPKTKNGAKSATNDSERIRHWWQCHSKDNIGLNAGKSRLVMIDIDEDKGGSVRDLPLTANELCTTTVRTGNGWHLYFRRPVGLDLSNSNKHCPKGIDIRAGDGSYVVAPPSLHISGRIYQFVGGQEPWNTPPLPLPLSLLPILTIRNYPEENTETAIPPRPPDIANSTRHPYTDKALRDELDRLARAREGRRNITLNSVAFSLGQLVGVGLLNRTEVEQLLTQVAHSIGLGEIEIRKTIRSGLDAGIRTPRSSWPDLTKSFKS